MKHKTLAFLSINSSNFVVYKEVQINKFVLREKRLTETRYRQFRLC